MASVTIHPGRLKGVVSAPPSKSQTHRAILLAAMTRGKSRIHRVALSDDIRATMNAARALGADISLSGDTLIIIGGPKPPSFPLIDCGESGSTLRFSLPIALAIGNGARFVGRDRLGQRPMKPYEDICRRQGIAYEQRMSHVLDLKVQGALSPAAFTLPGDISSQFISGLLMALPVLDGDSSIKLTGPVESRDYIDLTLETLRLFGGAAAWKGDQALAVPGNQRYRGAELTIEGDYSQAAVFLCAAALGHDVTVDHLPQTTAQADQRVRKHLMMLGASVSLADGQMRVTADPLSGTGIDGSQCPDIVPILALTAALARGRTVITGAARLRLKESDRLEATRVELARLGARIEETQDGFVIDGVPSLKGGVACDCHNDHRIAMMLSVAALMADAPVTLNGVECLSKSYPHFLQDFAALGGVIDE